MSVPMKARRTSREVRIQVGDRKPRLFLVPKARAAEFLQLLEVFEVDREGAVPWHVPVQDLIDKYTQPGTALRGARAKEGLSQTALASRLGIPPSNISEMEGGKRPIGKKMARRLSKVLGVDYRVFL